jgi:hypothetical protein
MAFPRADNDFVVWFNQFAQAFAVHGQGLGFSADEIAAVQKDAAMFNYLVGELLPTYRAAMQTRTSYKNLIKDGPIGEPGGSVPAPPPASVPPATVEPGIVPRLRQMIQRILAAPKYTEAIGQELDIVGGEEAAIDRATAKPTAKAVALPGNEVRIEFVKANFDGVLIEGRRSGESDWSALGTDNYSPYLDSRAPLAGGKPEIREYRLRYLLKDEPLGEWSDTISASTRV